VIVNGQSALRDAQARLNLLRVPAQTSTRDLQDALAALDRSGSSDPAVAEARSHVESALAAVGGEQQQRLTPAQAGSFAGLDASLRQRAGAGRGGRRQIDAAVVQAGQFQT
jgi:hypothetical protein